MSDPPKETRISAAPITPTGWSAEMQTGERIWTGRPTLASDPTGPLPEIRVQFQGGKVSVKNAKNLK